MTPFFIYRSTFTKFSKKKQIVLWHVYKKYIMHLILKNGTFSRRTFYIQAFKNKSVGIICIHSIET